MANYIRVWCDFDIGGDFSGNETVLRVDDCCGIDEIDRMLNEKYDWLFDMAEYSSYWDMEEAGLIGWHYIAMEQLK